MNHQGHPMRPLERASLPIDSLVNDFLAQTREESPALAKYLDDLDLVGKNELGGVLGRFDFHKRGSLDPHERLMARRILGRLHRPSKDSLTLTNQILDYLDLNHNAVLEEDEVSFTIEILEMFATADSDNDTLSEIELGMLYAVLRHLDKTDNHVLDAAERQQLHDALKAPRAFLERQKVVNPLLVKLLENR